MQVHLKIILGFSLCFLLSLTENKFVCAQGKTANDTIAAKMPSMHISGFDKTHRFKGSIGLSMVKPPKDMVETAVQAPLFNLHGIYHLPWKFSVEGDFSSLLVSNQLSLGPGINLGKDDFAIKIGWNIAFVAGRLKQFGFDNTTKALLYYPNISSSYRWNEMVFTLKGELVTVAYVSTKTGENELTLTKNFYNGWTGAIYIEQRIHGNRTFIIGFRDSYVKYYWPTWMTFSTFNRFYHVPELSFSWIFK
jgi:hypothetical protein